MNNFKSKTWSEVVDLYQKSQPEGWSFIPSKQYSSERMGGWIIRDDTDHYIGWVGNRGDVTYCGWEYTTPDTKLDERGRRVK